MMKPPANAIGARPDRVSTPTALFQTGEMIWRRLPTLSSTRMRPDDADHHGHLPDVLGAVHMLGEVVHLVDRRIGESAMCAAIVT